MNNTKIKGMGVVFISLMKYNKKKKSKVLKTSSLPLSKSAKIYFKNSLSFWHFDIKNTQISIHFLLY